MSAYSLGIIVFKQLADIFHSHTINMSVNETNGRVTLTTPSELKISKSLKTMLGLQIKGRFFQSKLIKIYLFIHLFKIS